MIDFELKPNQSGVLLNWTVNNEIELFGFDIEKSYNGSDWLKIGETYSIKGMLNYNFYDMNIPSTTINTYYRLVMRKINGRNTYSNVLNFRKLTYNDVIIYPVPVNDILYINLKNSIDNEFFPQIRLTNLIGQNISLDNILIKNSENIIEINFKLLESGFYFLQINDKTYKINKY